LAGVLQPARVEAGSAFERLACRLDEIIAGYASRYFKGRAAPFAPPASLKESWKLLGQGYLTVLLDLFYTYLILNFVLQFRFVILLLTSPVQWWRERKVRKAAPPTLTEPIALLQESMTSQLPVGSVSEQTTERLADYTPPPRERA